MQLSHKNLWKKRISRHNSLYNLIHILSVLNLKKRQLHESSKTWTKEVAGYWVTLSFKLKVFLSRLNIKLINWLSEISPTEKDRYWSN